MSRYDQKLSMLASAAFHAARVGRCAYVHATPSGWAWGWENWDAEGGSLARYAVGGDGTFYTSAALAARDRARGLAA